MESSFHLFFILIFLSFSNCQVYEFGSISWTTQNTTTSVNFHVKLAFSGTNSIGSTYSSSNTFHFGDGNFISLPSLKVISQLSNVFITETYFSYTYSSNSNNGSYWIAYLRGCCRSQSLLNNANSTFFLQTQLNLNNAVGNASPVSEASPIIRTVKGPNSISIYAIDPNGDSLTFGLASPNQFSDGSGSQPIGLSIDPQIGVISWDTSSITNGLYSAVIFVSDSQSNIASIEFMLLVNNNPGSCASSCLNSGFTCLVGSLTCLLCGNAPNPCVPSSPPYFLSQTLPLSNFLFLAPGIPFVQTIQAADLDLLQTVSLSNLGMPEGATFVTLGLNPVIGTMSWTPTQSQVGMNNVCFQALNSLGLAAPLLCLTLEVGMNFPVNLLINGNAETNSLIGWTINSGTFITVPSNIGSYSFCDPSGTAVRTQVIDLLTYGLLPIQVLDQGLGINFQQGYYPQSIPDAEIFTLNVSVIDSSDQILASKVMTYVPSNTQPFIFSYSFTQIAGTPKLIIWQDTVQNGNCKTYLDNASVTLSLILNPFGNLCSITPGIGTAFQTNFTIQCQNSLNTGLSLLSFQFFYTYNGETISLGAPSTSSSRNLVLPEGNITAYVEIGTILGSFISVTTNPVTVLSFGAPPSLSQVITEVAIWEVTQKYEDVLNTIFVGTTILQGNPIALNQIIRETLMNQTQLSISKIIENKDSITQQSRVIEAIIANASEVDLYVRYSSINLLQNLTKISLIVSLEPQAFQNIGKGLSNWLEVTTKLSQPELAEAYQFLEVLRTLSISQLQNNISCNIPPPLLNTSNLVSQSQKILSVFLTLNAFDVILSNQVITQLLSITQNGCFESQQSSFPNIFSASARDTNFTFLSDLYALDLRFLQEDISISNLSQPIQIMIPLFSNLLNIPTLNFSDSINNSTTSNSTTNSTFQCLFWNTTSNNWSSEGCKLVSLNPTQALCECNHLTIFVIGTLQDLIPPINQITPSNFNPQLAKQNYAIPILVGGVLIIFLSSILIVCIVEFIKARDSVDIPESHFEQKTVKKRRKNFLKRFWFALKHRHSFVGIFSCRENDPYNRRQRITLFIMKVLIMLALCAVFLENNQDSFEDTNLIACLGLSVFSSMASTPSLILILFFQFAKPKRSDKALPQMYKFPHCFIYIGYVIAILLIIVCSGVSILYSFTFSNSQVINWLITFCFAIPQNLLLNEPLRIFILAVMKHCYLVKIRHQPSTHLEDIFQSSIANSEDSEESSTPSSFYLSSLSSYHSASRSPSDFQSLSKTNSSSV